jgi:hypothetical protein
MTRRTCGTQVLENVKVLAGLGLGVISPAEAIEQSFRSGRSWSPRAGRVTAFLASPQAHLLQDAHEQFVYVMLNPAGSFYELTFARGRQGFAL